MGKEELDELPRVPDGAGGSMRPAVAMQAQFVRFGGMSWRAVLSPGMKVMPRGIL